MKNNNQNQQVAFESSPFHRDQYRRTLSWLLFMVILCAVLSLVLFFINITQKKSSFYATTSSGLVIPLHTLDEPIVSNSYLAQWASLATRRALNLDFVHYKDQLDQAKIYFTSGGWQKYLIALDKSGLLKTVQSKKLIMAVVVSDVPVILNRDIVRGRYTWRVQFPILVTFSSASEQSKLKLLVTLNVQRVSVLETAEGIQISDFAAERGLD